MAISVRARVCVAIPIAQIKCSVFFGVQWRISRKLCEEIPDTDRYRKFLRPKKHLKHILTAQ